MKRESQPDEKIEPRNYWSIVERQFRKNRVAVAGLIIVAGLFAVAVVADFVANDKPLVMSYRGETYFPVLKDYGVWLHLSRWQREFQNISYKDFAAANFKDGDWAWAVSTSLPG